MKIQSFAVFAALAAAFANPASAQDTKPTIVLVHGAFAESSSWNGVVAELLAAGYPIVAADNPLRGLRSDADHVAGIVRSVKGPVVLVGHSYGGSVITNVKEANVKALVFVAAFSLDEGESTFGMAGRFPGSTLGDALAAPVVHPDGGKDLYIRQDKFGAQFAADIPEKDAKLAAATQRPILEAAGVERSGVPSWRALPSFHIYGDKDNNIPPVAMKFMAERADSKETVVLRGASHVPMVSQPGAVAAIINRAATHGASSNL